ncbi:MAG: peptidyl-prolyl cis-trans isomerase [Deltaproteobacteria bacterium]|nr:peptidyl-prolyl cis-trans isomerase [Deltaproteobacteria bacterium]
MRIRNRLTRIGLAGLLITSAAACGRQSLPVAALPESPVVATVAGVPIHASQVALQMRHKDRRGALDELVTFEVLARAAASAGTDEPQATEREALRLLKIQRLVQREIEPRLTHDAIDEADVRAVYDRAKSRFVHGRLVETAVLCLFTGARMRPEPRARIEDNARKLKTYLAHRSSYSRVDFEAISKDPIWIERKVSFATVWQEEGQDRPFPKVVGRAIHALAAPGAITDLVGDETGYYIALYLSEKAPSNVSFAAAASEIRQEMYEPWRRQKFLQLALAMAQGHDIEVFPENFPLLTGAD